MEFEYIGKEGARFGQFAVRVDGVMMFGRYESSPHLVTLNGAQLALCVFGPAFTFSTNVAYKERELPDFLVVLRKSYDAVFSEMNNEHGGEK